MELVKQYLKDKDRIGRLNSEITVTEQSVPAIQKARMEVDSLKKALKQAQQAEKDAIAELESDDDTYAELLREQTTTADRIEKNTEIIKQLALAGRLENDTAANVPIGGGCYVDSTAITGWHLASWCQAVEFSQWLDRHEMRKLVTLKVTASVKDSADFRAVLWFMATHKVPVPVTWDISLRKNGNVTIIEDNDNES